jgi:transcriptional regulator GlxA family with amidase domain
VQHSSRQPPKSFSGSGETKTIVFLAAPQTQIIDVAGPYQIFVRAAELFVSEHPAARTPYRVLLASTTPTRMIPTNCGLSLVASTSYLNVPRPIDTLLIAGGTGLEKAGSDPRLIKWLRAITPRTRRFGSICTGAFLLARAGLLNGRRVTTHWKWADALQSKCGDAAIDPDPIFIRDGNLYTTAGVTAGMDLALALVEEDLGSTIALKVAREMVLYLRRPGGQSQFSAALALQASDSEPIAEVHSFVLDHLNGDLSVEALARCARMTPRSFARKFTAASGVTPAKFVERLRLEAARRRLEESREKVERIAYECGLGTAETMRRSFLRIVGVSPSDYRERFATRAKCNGLDKA